MLWLRIAPRELFTECAAIRRPGREEADFSELDERIELHTAERLAIAGRECVFDAVGLSGEWLVVDADPVRIDGATG